MDDREIIRDVPDDFNHSVGCEHLYQSRDHGMIVQSWRIKVTTYLRACDLQLTRWDKN